MIYRIDYQHFLSHAIDHFSLDDIMNAQYLIISAKITNTGKCRNIVKMNDLYPDTITVIAYAETGDKKLLEEMYFEMLEPKDKELKAEYRRSNPYTTTIYQSIINPLLNHYNVIIICDTAENDYIDCFCKFLKKNYSVEVIDLNELFTKGRVGSIYVDRDEIRDKAVDIRRAAVREQAHAMASTRDGKEALIEKMTKKQKLKELKRLGIKVSPDEKDLDVLLFEEWCRADGQWDEDE